MTCMIVVILYHRLLKRRAALLEAYVFLLQSGQDLHVVCASLPPCAVPLALIKVIVLEWVHHTCDYMASLVVDNSTALDTFCKDTEDFLGTYQINRFAGLLKAPVDLCCEGRNRGQSANWSPSQTTSPAVGLETYFLVAEALLLFLLISCYNSGHFFYVDYFGQVADQKPLDKEVTKETHKVRRRTRLANQTAVAV
ncbi:hypothetical protein HPB50_029505 [Hyalomma asiaticum]|nr:hypothetical protein HPB50_029505 [Hyalomma asiaticum]